MSLKNVLTLAGSNIEPLLTFHQAAEATGVPYWKIQRAGKSGVLRTYQLLNSRRYVRMSDIERLLNAQRF